ncbi:hypothetical protein ES705_41453 [subsurface metagenome]
MKKISLICLAAAAVVLAVSSTAVADWDPNYKMHWPQLPDLSPTGMDIDNMWVTLADDFKCIETGPIADIHIWASFADDILPAAGPGSLSFHLSIHADIPDPNPEDPSDWSMPGEELWSGLFVPGQYTVRQVADDIWEDWYDPATGVWIDDNHKQAYQYNFYPEDPFIQEYCNTYWLDVKVLVPIEPDFTFGWKTSEARHPDLRWGDDAVWGDAPGAWLPLTYPLDHEYEGETLDLAFVITPEPATLGLLLLAGLALLRKRRK